MRWPLLRAEVTEWSMIPALLPGDWLLARRVRSVRPGWIVLAANPDKPDMLLVKRVISHVPGGWWLASDNTAAGAVDSSRFGPVPPELMVGRVLLRYWPRPRLFPRTDRGASPG